MILTTGGSLFIPVVPTPGTGIKYHVLTACQGVGGEAGRKMRSPATNDQICILFASSKLNELILNQLLYHLDKLIMVMSSQHEVEEANRVQEVECRKLEHIKTVTQHTISISYIDIY